MDRDEAMAMTRAVTSASLCDAMARVHAHRCHALGLQPARPGTVTAGFAATVRMGPRRDDLPDHDLAQAAAHALADLPPLARLADATTLRFVDAALVGDDLRIVARPPGRELF